jgi:hypothetical protein
MWQRSTRSTPSICCVTGADAMIATAATLPRAEALPLTLRRRLSIFEIEHRLLLVCRTNDLRRGLSRLDLGLAHLAQEAPVETHELMVVRKVARSKLVPLLHRREKFVQRDCA